MTDRFLKTGVFLAPFHPLHENPLLALDRDMELLEHLDRLNYHEAWIGEHHSAGFEIIACPEMFIAAAAERTRHIRLGTGVVSLPYHNPFTVAGRLMQLDYMTRGRAMFGVGPGSLVYDAVKMGLKAEDQRRKLDESLDVIVELMQGRMVTKKTDWFDLQEARLQLKSYSQPSMEMAVASSRSPTGALAAGRHGIGMISIGGTSDDALKAHASNWGVYENAAKANGKTADRRKWRIVTFAHVAETREQAHRDVKFGLEDFKRYFSEVATFPIIPPDITTDPAEYLVSIGLACIGTPDDCVRHFERLWKGSDGGFGGVLLLAHNWADWPATKRSYELMARYVHPHFQQDSNGLRVWSYDDAKAKYQTAGAQSKAAVQAAIDPRREWRNTAIDATDDQAALPDRNTPARRRTATHEGEPPMLQQTPPTVRELPEITIKTDTRDILSHATIQAEGLEDYFLVDIDAHVTETQFWPEVLELIDNDVIRQMGQAMMQRPGTATALLNAQPGTLYQNVYGRIPHQLALAEAVDGGECHTFTQLARRSMDAMGLDYQVVFPTPMLVLGMHPQDDIEAAVGRAYNRWLIERILPQDERIKALLYLPFNTPQACIDIVKDFGDAKGVIGFAVTATRNKPVHHDQYMKLYAMIEESGKPLAFHSGFHWGDPSFAQLNRFISMHALSFVHYSLIHLTNWVINGLPERFPKLKLVWVESGLAWVPFIMQRLDHEFMMRVCEAPMLKRPPSEYIREMFFTTQPLEKTNMMLLEASFRAVNAETQLLFASDWPHWDFDPPSSITTIPFLSEQAKRNILGLNAARVFNLDVKRTRPRARDVQAARAVVA